MTAPTRVRRADMPEELRSKIRAGARKYANSEQGKEKKRLWRIAHREEHNRRVRERKGWAPYQALRRRWAWRKRYGISEAQYLALLEAQGGKCAICLLPPEAGRFLTVDHDHATNVVRGLLCTMCNHGLGRFKDDIDLMANGIEYLRLAALKASAPPIPKGEQR